MFPSFVGCVLAVIVVLVGGRQFPRWRNRIAFLLVPAALSGLGWIRATSAGAVDESPSQAYANATRDRNAFEAFYAAKRWSETEPEGILALAREAQRFGLYRTCVETLARLEGGPLANADEAHSLRAECTHQPADGVAP